jgi:uncharacterized membrane protein YbhN (UPF0104 family)
MTTLEMVNATGAAVRTFSHEAIRPAARRSGAPARTSYAGMSPTAWAWARLGGGAAILAVLVWRLGTGPFIHGIGTVGAGSLAAAAGIALVTTVMCAWRWTVVARGLGVGLPLRSAVAAYYRSQFLNTTLPGGVLGDVHRAVRHGRDAGDLGRGLRAVAWERSAGQVIQVIVALGVLLTVASPVRAAMPTVAAVLVALAIVAVVVGRALPSDGPSRWHRAVRAIRADVRGGLLARPAWPAVALGSAVVVAGHTATFLLAARTAGTVGSPFRLLPIAMLVLLATAVPANIGGWGPREGVTAWLFGAAGLGPAQGVETATVYGVLILAANLPGAGVMAWAWCRRRLPRRDQPDPASALEPRDVEPSASEPGSVAATVRPEVVRHG